MISRDIPYQNAERLRSELFICKSLDGHSLHHEAINESYFQREYYFR